MPSLFKEERIEQLKARYEMPGIKPPALYNFVCFEKWLPIREELDGWFQMLTTDSQEKFLVNFWNPDAFIQSYNELNAVGLFLAKGFQAHYEPVIDDLTPDWLIETKDRSFILEVFSRLPPADIEARDRQVTDLWDRLLEIKIGANLLLSYEKLRDLPELNPQINKAIARDVRLWLSDEVNLVSGSEYATMGLTFTLASFDPRRARVGLAGPTSSAFFVDSQPVKKTLDEKVKKYAELAAMNGLSLVVGIAPSFTSGIDEEELDDILTGDEVFVVSADGSGHRSRKNNGILDKRPSLAAVIGIWRENFALRTIVVRNPNAELPLDEYILDPNPC